VFDKLLTDNEAFEYTGNRKSLIPTDDGKKHVWAEDVIYNKKTEKYYMYFCMTSTWNASNLCYATADRAEGPYKWQGALLYSGITKDTIGATDVTKYVDEKTAIDTYTTKNGAEYNFNNYPNAIDPTVFYDEDDRLWMVYGSWSGGIFLIELSEDGTECIHPEADPENNVDTYFGKRLIGGRHRSIEGPWITYDRDAGYYYLFVSYGGLSRDGGYQIRVFRSKTVDGEYVDMNGNSCPLSGADHKNFGLKLSGNYYLPSLPEGYMATGHNSALIDDDGKRYLCYHTRFDNGGENFSDRIKQYFINEEGWPVVLPYATDGETISETGYEDSELAGRYYMVNQGIEINAEVAQPVMVDLLGDGSVRGDGIEGKWTYSDGSCNMTITCDGVTYKGVFCRQNDEAGTPVMTFTAAGSNQSLWGVKY
jgi:arabinan endo-1,5-alpha-L-arabinosidase